jgi:hypothetical protein
MSKLDTGMAMNVVGGIAYMRLSARIVVRFLNGE